MPSIEIEEVLIPKSRCNKHISKSGRTSGRGLGVITFEKFRMVLESFCFGFWRKLGTTFRTNSAPQYNVRMADEGGAAARRTGGAHTFRFFIFTYVETNEVEDYMMN